MFQYFSKAPVYTIDKNNILSFNIQNLFYFIIHNA